MATNWLRLQGVWIDATEGPDTGPAPVITEPRSSVNIRNSVHGGFKSVTWAPIIKKTGGRGMDIT